MEELKVFVKAVDYGFNYAVYTSSIHEPKSKEIFRSASKEDCITVKKCIIEGLPYDHIFYSCERKPKLLIINDRNYVSHYIVYDADDLDKLSFNILKHYIKNNNVQECTYTPSLTQEYVDSCPDVHIKADLSNKLKAQTSLADKSIKHNGLLRAIQLKIENANIIGCYLLLQTSEWMNIELKDFDTYYIN